MCASSCSSAVLLRRSRSFSSISTAAVAARPASLPPVSAAGDGVGPPRARSRVATGAAACASRQCGCGNATPMPCAATSPSSPTN
uniref:Uncharacterized protein n=1 Tax=Arundo donax TaxID=35708 RepID=A0A0A9CG34_ARUDO